jgi:hypothetical protein
MREEVERGERKKEKETPVMREKTRCGQLGDGARADPAGESDPSPVTFDQAPIPPRAGSTGLGWGPPCAGRRRRRKDG